MKKGFTLGEEKERGKCNEILRSLHSLRMTGDTTAPSLIVRGQNFLKNVVNLEIRERVKGKEILRSLRSLRMTLSKYISLSKGEGQGEGFITNKVNELINLSTYPLINFNKIYPRPLRDTSRTGELESRVRLRAVWLRARERGKKAAFTLAETLITLGIIGIVAAMTIPNLITEHKKRTTVTKLQRAISLLNQAYKLSYDEVGEPESAFDLGPEEYFKTYWAPYIKVLTYCSSYSVCGYQKRQPFKALSNEDCGFTLVTSFGRTTFLTSDGFLYSILTSAGDYKAPQYYVVLDLNGSQEPNTYGKDVFVLKRVPEKGVMPNGYNLSNEEVKTGCSINTGTTLGNQYCAEKIRRAGWKIDKDYPWK